MHERETFSTDNGGTLTGSEGGGDDGGYQGAGGRGTGGSEMFIKSFFKIQFPHKFVNFSFYIVSS